MDIVDKMRVMADDVGGDLAWCDEAADTIIELRKRIAAQETDAERYRWLKREVDHGDSLALCEMWSGSGESYWSPIAAFCDEFVDAAMKQEG